MRVENGFSAPGASERRPYQHPLNDDRPQGKRHCRRENVRGRDTRDRRSISAHGACHHVAAKRSTTAAPMGGSGKQKATALVTSNAATGVATSRSKVAAAINRAYFRSAPAVRPAPMQRSPIASDASPRCLSVCTSVSGQLEAFPEEAAYGCQNQRVRDDALQGLAKKSPTGKGRAGPVAFLPVHLPVVVSAFRSPFGLRHRPRERVADRPPHRNEKRKECERFVAADTGRQRKADVGIESKPALKDGRVRYVVGSDEVPDSPGKPRRKAHRENARRKKKIAASPSATVLPATERKSVQEEARSCPQLRAQFTFSGRLLLVLPTTARAFCLPRMVTELQTASAGLPKSTRLPRFRTRRPSSVRSMSGRPQRPARKEKRRSTVEGRFVRRLRSAKRGAGAVARPRVLRRCSACRSRTR